MAGDIVFWKPGEKSMTWKQRERLYNTSARTAWDKELPTSNMYPPNMTVDWLDTDTPENAQYEKDIKYTFNEHGFRSDSFYDEAAFRILIVGCSMSVGVGVDQHEIWANKLKQKIADYTTQSVVAYNLSTSGASSDYVTRTIYKVDADLKPHLVFVYWPPITRLELPYEHNDGKIIQTAIEDSGFPKQLVDEDYLLFNFRKNLSFLRTMFHSHYSSFFCNPVVETLIQHQMQDNNPFVMNTGARDGMHPDSDWHERVADHFFNESLGIIDNLIANPNAET